MLTAILFIVISTECRRPPVRDVCARDEQKPPRGLSASLLRIVVLPSVSCKTVSTSVHSASSAAAVPRCSSSLLLRFLLPLWVSYATVSPVVLPASDAAAVSRLLSSLLLRFLLLPSVSCATFSTRVLSASAAAAVFFASFLVSCASFSFVAAAFFYRDDNILIPFLELGHFNVVFLGFFLVFSIYSRLVFCVPSPDIDFFSSMLIKRVAITHLWSLPM